MAITGHIRSLDVIEEVVAGDAPTKTAIRARYERERSFLQMLAQRHADVVGVVRAGTKTLSRTRKGVSRSAAAGPKIAGFLAGGPTPHFPANRGRVIDLTKADGGKRGF